MPKVKLTIDWWAGFVPAAPSGCEIRVEEKLHQFPQKMQVIIPVKNWQHPAGVTCYVHTLDDTEENLLDVQHGEMVSGNMNCLLAENNREYKLLLDSIPEVKEAVDDLLRQMEGKWYQTYASASFLKLDYHKEIAPN